MTPSTMPLVEHLVEFRSRLVKAMLAVAAGTILAFSYHEQILALLAKPYELAVPEGSLAFFKPMEAFATVMRLSLFGGLILASLVVLHQIWCFAAPALTAKERKWAYPIVAAFGAPLLLGRFRRLRRARTRSRFPSRLRWRHPRTHYRCRLLPQIR